MRLVSIVRSLTSGSVLAADLALSSCDGSGALGLSDTIITDVVQARALWEDRAPREYTFVLEISCFCPDLRRVVVRVRDGEVRDVTGAHSA